MRSRAVSAVLTAFIVLAAAQTAHATLSDALSLSELVAQSERVVVVTCESEAALRDHFGRIVTDYQVHVEEGMHGEARPGDELTVRSLGGDLGDLGMRIEGEPVLEVGHRYLLFLRAARTASGARVMRPVGMSQGALPIQEQHGVLTVLPGGAGLALVRRARGGQLVPAPSALLHPEALERVRERIVDLAGSGAVRP